LNVERPVNQRGTWPLRRRRWRQHHTSGQRHMTAHTARACSLSPILTIRQSFSYLYN